jgi:signal transduction histidine kinase
MARLLIVEDDRLSAEETAHVVRDAGHQVVGSVGTGEQALALAKEARPDLALVDVMLPGAMDGIRVAEHLRDYDVGTIYVTGHTDVQVLRRASQSLAYCYVVKPVDPRTLAANVEMALARLNTDRALRAHGLWLATLLRNIGVAVLATTPEGLVRYANPVAERLMMIETGVRQRVSRCLMLVDEKGRSFDPLQEAGASASGLDLPLGTGLCRLDGTTLPIEGSIASLPGESGDCQGLVLAFRDVSERRTRERELQRAERLESLGTLAAGVAHDFNNMLAIILNSASLAKRSADPDSVTRDLLSDVERAASRASNLTQQLMAFAKGGAPAQKPMWLEPMLERSVSLALRGSALNPRYEIAEGLWPAYADEGQLGQVVTNLVLNARDATGDEGTITIRLENRVVQGDATLADGRYVEIAVSDTGAGMTSEQLDRVFDPYYTTKDDGHGLGLASAYSIAQRHGGALRARSTLGEGSTFVFLVPAAEEPPISVTPSERPVQRGTGRLLVMDDETDLRRVLALCLEELGYVVACAADGEEAIALFDLALRDQRPFDAVILDLTVRGGMGGLETLEQLRRLTPEVRAIASSGYSDSPVLADHARHGFAGILPKPYRFTDLALVLRTVVQAPTPGMA